MIRRLVLTLALGLVFAFAILAQRQGPVVSAACASYNFSRDCAPAGEVYPRPEPQVVVP